MGDEASLLLGPLAAALGISGLPLALREGKAKFGGEKMTDFHGFTTCSEMDYDEADPLLGGGLNGGNQELEPRVGVGEHLV